MKHDDCAAILTAAEGYLELGMLDNAALELEKLTPEQRNDSRVGALRCRIFQAASQWAAMMDTARHLVTIQPENLEGWLMAALATRRAVEGLEGLDLAEKTLKLAAFYHPGKPAVCYQLACLSCLLGELEAARGWLRKACEADGSLKLKALDEPDLAALW